MTILLFISLHAFWPKGYQRRNHAKNNKKDNYLKQAMQKDVHLRLKLPQSVVRMSMKFLETVQQSNAIDVSNFVLVYIMFVLFFKSFTSIFVVVITY